MLWVTSFNVCDLKLYQDRGNVILVKLKSGHVESIENIDLFYYNKHYELIVPLVNTDEQYISEVDDDDIHPECDSIFKNITFASSIYQKTRNPQEKIHLISMKATTYLKMKSKLNQN